MDLPTSEAVENEVDLEEELTDAELEAATDPNQGADPANEPVAVVQTEDPGEGEEEDENRINLKELGHKIQANYAFEVDVKPVTFHFKTVKDDTGTETKRASVETALPFPSVQGIIDILEGSNDVDDEGNEVNQNHDKEMELLMDAIEAVVITNARAMIADDLEITAETLDVNKLSWRYIALLPKSTRAGGGIAKETWDAFCDNYISVMPEATGKTVGQVTRAGKILLNKFSSTKTNKPVLQLMIGQLAIYMENSKDAELYSACVEFLLKKADELVNVSDEELLAAL